MSATSSKHEALLLRKRMLRLRSASLRQTLGDQVGQGLAPALRVADTVVAGGQWLRRHPVWLMVPLVALFVWRPRAVTGGVVPMLGRLARRGLWAWQTWLRLRPLVEGIRAQMAAGSRPGR